MFDPPIFINVRDRVTPLRQLVGWLERAGHENIRLIDNASTYEPLLDYLDDTPHPVIRLARNAGSRSIWELGIVPEHDWFVYTDPDVIPTEHCPVDLVAHLHGVLRRHGEYGKAGPGLYLDDVPATLPSLSWERGPVINGPELEPGARRSLIDTTFALHAPGADFRYEAIRCDAPYQARHASWYVTTPGPEDVYYLEHAIAGPLGSSWAQDHQAAA